MKSARSIDGMAYARMFHNKLVEMWLFQFKTFAEET
jgi:hypothetical protein